MMGLHPTSVDEHYIDTLKKRNPISTNGLIVVLEKSE